MLLNLAMACGCARRYADGVNYATLGIREAPGFAPLYAHLAVNHVGLGEITKARVALDEATRIAPGQVERSLAGLMFRKQEHQLGARPSSASPPDWKTRAPQTLCVEADKRPR